MSSTSSASGVTDKLNSLAGLYLQVNLNWPIITSNASSFSCSNQFCRRTRKSPHLLWLWGITVSQLRATCFGRDTPEHFARLHRIASPYGHFSSKTPRLPLAIGSSRWSSRPVKSLRAPPSSAKIVHVRFLITASPIAYAPLGRKRPVVKRPRSGVEPLTNVPSAGKAACPYPDYSLLGAAPWFQSRERKRAVFAPRPRPGVHGP